MLLLKGAISIAPFSLSGAALVGGKKCPISKYPPVASGVCLLA
jgi:hypothetical protein